MTQDEIIEIYKEVSNKLCNGTEWCWAGVGEPLQLFAKLVEERTAAKAFPDGVDAEWIARRTKYAVEQEREACAKVCEAYQDPFAGNAMADAIRARGEA